MYAIRLFRRPSNPFPRVKTPAAYVRVRCYTPARFSNFVKDFLAGAYHYTSKESKHVFGFCWRRGRRDYYGKAAVVVGPSMCYLGYLGLGVF